MKRKISLFVIILLTVAVIAAGCGANSKNQDETGTAVTNEDGLFEFDFPSVPWSDPVYIAEAQGFFKKYGLKANFIGYMANKNDNVTNVASGNIPFGCNHASSIATAISNGYSIIAIAAGWGTSEEKPMNSLITLADSGINTVEDLKEKGGKVAICAEKEMPWLVARDAYGLKGKIEEVVINLENMENALFSKQVDAIYVVIPFSEQIIRTRSDEIKVIGSQVDAINFEEKGWPQQFVNKKFAEDNPEIVKAYVSALADACDWAREHPDEAGVIIAHALDVDESQGAIYNPVFPEHALIDEYDAQFWLDKSKEYGLVKEEMTLSELYTNEYNPYFNQ